MAARSPSSAPSSAPLPSPVALPLPKRWTFEETADCLRVSWRARMADFGFPLAALWVGGGGVGTGLRVLAEKGLQPAAVLCLLVFGGILLVAAYGLYAMVRNRTVVEVSASGLTLRRCPVPWLGNCQLPLEDLQHLQIHRWQRQSPSYAVCAGEGERERPIWSFPSEQQAQFFLGALERAADRWPPPSRGSPGT